MSQDSEPSSRTDDVKVADDLTFTTYLLSDSLLSALKELNFVKPLPIQSRILPLVKSGLDMIVRSKSGKGKTMAQFEKELKFPQSLIIVPTRDIAVQIVDVLTDLGKHSKSLEARSFIDGGNLNDDRKNIQSCSVIVGTPGRIMHLIKSEILNIFDLKTLVLDEADKLLENGSLKLEVLAIQKLLSKGNQIIATSATVIEELEITLKKMMNPTGIIPDIDQIPSELTCNQCLMFTEKPNYYRDYLKKIVRNDKVNDGSQDQETRFQVLHKNIVPRCKNLITKSFLSQGTLIASIRWILRLFVDNINQKMGIDLESTSAGVVSDNYSSCLMNEFDVTQCLGKGGFGVVFEAKNKLDDCNYAIKRIILPSKQEHRDRVMREVKTLANCDHKNIVRYFHSWVEQPPSGWQEEKDKELLARDILSTSITIDSPSPTNESKAFAIDKDLKSKNSRSTTDGSRDIMNSTLADDTSSFIQFQASNNVSYTNDDDIIFKNPSITDADNGYDSIENELKNLAKDKASLDDSHVISEPYLRIFSDLSRCSATLSKKLNPISITTNSSNKMYLYIQMQLCKKESLKDWLFANDLEMRNGKTYDIFDQIVSAVHYVHSNGMIHRDLKPSNIFFALDGQIKVGDFGLVTDMCDTPVDSMTSSSGSSSGIYSDFTVAGDKKHTKGVGTHLYMSPEQAKGLPYNYKVDIYSLGMILFELLVYFCTVFERVKVLEGVKNHNYPPDFQKSFTDEYELLQLMIAKKPEERPTTLEIKETFLLKFKISEQKANKKLSSK